MRRRAGIDGVPSVQDDDAVRELGAVELVHQLRSMLKHGALVYGALVGDLSEIEGKGGVQKHRPPHPRGGARAVGRRCCRAPRKACRTILLLRTVESLQSRRRKDTAALDRVEVQIRDTRAPSKL